MKKIVFSIILLFFTIPAFARTIWIDGKPIESSYEFRASHGLRLENGATDILLRCPSLASDLTVYLPSHHGASDEVLSTDGAGSWTWKADSTGAGGGIGAGGCVPYTGATGDVNLGAYDVTATILYGSTLDTSDGIIVGTTRWSTTNNKIDGEQIYDDTIDDDSIDLVDITLTDFLNDVGYITGTGYVPFTGGTSDVNLGSYDLSCGTITITTGEDIYLGSTKWNILELIDGEQIYDDTIDDDSIDLVDVTLADFIEDIGMINKIPYTGATGNVNLGSYDVSADVVTGDTLVGNTLRIGTVTWDTTNDMIDGEQIYDDTIDDDSIDWTDVTIADWTGTQAAGAVAFDYGGATSFELPNTAGDVTCDADGEIAIDTTQYQLAFDSGTAEVAIPAIYILQVSFDPGSWYDSDSEVWLMDLHADRFPDGIRAIRAYVDSNVADPDVEMDLDLMYCDQVAGGALPGGSATTMCVLDTTTGNSSATPSVTVPTGKTIYLNFGADPEGTCTQLHFRLHYYIPES